MIRKTIRILLGGGIASATLTLLLYAFVFTQNLSAQLAIPWTNFRQDLLLIDWTYLFLVSFLMALLLGLNFSRLNPANGSIWGGVIGLIPTLTAYIMGWHSVGIGYYMACYLLWGWIFGLIAHQKQKLIIRHF